MQFLDLMEARRLRTLSREFCAAVKAYAWSSDVLVRSIFLWHACFPLATTLRYVGTPIFVPRHLQILRLDGARLFAGAFRDTRLKYVTLKGCKNVAAVLPLLSGLRTLDLSFSAFLGPALRHLKRVKQLSVRGCVRLTDDDLAPLTTLESLDISGTDLDRVLPELPRLKQLRLTHAARALPRLALDTLSACGVENLELPWGIKKANLAGITGSDDLLCPLIGATHVNLNDTKFDRLSPLQGVQELRLARASLRGLRDLRDLAHLDMTDTMPHVPATFGNLGHIGTLVASYCDWIHVDTFKYVRIDTLEMLCVRQSAQTMRLLCERTRVRRVTTCLCSCHKFEFPGGPLLCVISC